MHVKEAEVAAIQRDICLLCQQKDTNKTIYSSTDHGLLKIWNIYEERKDLPEDKWSTFLKQLSKYSREEFLSVDF